MPLTVKRSGRWTLRALLPWLVGAVPVVCGVLMMQWQAQRELEARALGATQQVLGHVERILDNIASAAQMPGLKIVPPGMHHNNAITLHRIAGTANTWIHWLVSLRWSPE